MSGPVVLVTGATGNVGSAVVRGLLARGAVVRAAVREPGAGGVTLDFLRPETFAPALAGADALFLLRPPAISRVRETLGALVDAAAAASVRHVVFLSVSGADTNRWIPHHVVERHVRQSGLGWTMLRPGFFAQNIGEAYRADIRERGEVYVPAGRGEVAWVDTRDLGEVAAQVLVDPAPHVGAAYTLTGGERRSFAEVAALLSRALGREVRYAPASVFGYVRRLRSRGLPWGQIAVLTLLHVGLRSGGAAEVDPTLGHLLGRPPRTVADYIADHAALWR